MKKLLRYLCVSLLVCVGVACSKSGIDTIPDPDVPPVDPLPDTLRVLKTGLQFPWEILWGKDNQLWITERNGKISRISPADGSTSFSQNFINVFAQGEGGMLGMVQHPDFVNNGLLYVYYNYLNNGQYRARVERYKFLNDALVEPLVLLDNIPASNIHNGSRLLITADNKLLITTGDAANTALPQLPSSLAGKVLRINLDGTIPADNPIAGNPMWSMGHRNPQGMVMVNNILYTSEHGPNIEDEINIIEKGSNYGWPNVNGPCDGAELSFCAANNIVQPIWSSGGSTLAYCGLDFYHADKLSIWKNSLLLVTLKDQSLRQLKLSDDRKSVLSSTTFFKNQFGRLRDLCVSPQGRVYIITSNGGNNDVIVEVGKLP